jgi:hypothetical protein
VRASAFELRSLVEDLEAGRGLDANGMISWPYPAPQLSGLAHWALDLYDDDALTRLVNRTYTNALLIYQSLVELWFPTLRPTLGLACILPVSITGTVSRIQVNHPFPDDFPGHTISLKMTLLPPGADSTVAIVFRAEGAPDLDFEAIQRHQSDVSGKVRLWHPGSEPWGNAWNYSAGLTVPGDTPATNLAYAWLWKDLTALRIVSSTLPGEW